jgi:hypothetical protein
MKRSGKFYPGWKMTWDQHSAYFRLLESADRANGKITAADKEEMRKLIHIRAFGIPISAKVIDHMKMFDDFKAECLAWSQPANVDAQKYQVDMPLIRLRHGILEKFDSPTILGLLHSARFKRDSLDDLNDMNEKDLTDLRNTLCARTAGEVAVPVESDLAGEEQAEDAPVEREGVPF